MRLTNYMTNRKENWNGMNWIRQTSRLAIYLRDGLSCVYCGDSVENGAQLTLDHVRPHSKGGSNEASNLVTCCHRCNCSRGNRSVAKFAIAVASYLNHNVKSELIVKHVQTCVKRDMKEFRTQANQMVALRGSAAKVLATLAD
jgi:5-methylcytosine-specific restriction endonuclease McrA